MVPLILIITHSSLMFHWDGEFGDAILSLRKAVLISLHHSLRNGPSFKDEIGQITFALQL